MNIVHWKELVQHYFGDEQLFEKITRAILYCHRSDTPVSKAFDKLDIDIQEKYDLTRWHMRKHGWHSGYIERDVLKFLCTVPVQDRSYISLSAYINAIKDAELDEMIDDYYNTKKIMADVTWDINRPKPRKDIDGDDEGGLLG